MIVEVDAIYGRLDASDMVTRHDAYLKAHWVGYVEYSHPRPLGAIWAYCFTSLVCEVPHYDWQVPWPGEREWRCHYGVAEARRLVHLVNP